MYTVKVHVCITVATAVPFWNNYKNALGLVIMHAFTYTDLKQLSHT